MESKSSAPNYYKLSEKERNEYYKMGDSAYISFLDENLDKIFKGDSSNLKSLFAEDSQNSGTLRQPS